MMKIRSLTIPDGAWLAPMAGVTDLPFRLLCHELGAAMLVTEMVSAKGYLCAPENSRAVQSLLLHAPQEGPVALQLFGHEPEVMAEAAKRLAGHGFAAIDLNMGCPAPKITGGGDGSGLLRDLPLAAQVIRAVRRAVDLPLMVKTRLGWDDSSIVVHEFARVAEAEGADALTVHGRTRMQFYAGQADWEAIAAVKAAAGIPVIGNGDVQTAEDALMRLSQSGCDAVMIGRGAMGNPWLFQQVRQALWGEPVSPPDAMDRAQMLLRHARMLAAWKGEDVAVCEMRKHGAWYTKGLHGAVQMRATIQAASTLAQLEDAVHCLWQ